MSVRSACTLFHELSALRLGWTAVGHLRCAYSAQAAPCFLSMKLSARRSTCRTEVQRRRINSTPARRTCQYGARHTTFASSRAIEPRLTLIPLALFAIPSRDDQRGAEPGLPSTWCIDIIDIISIPPERIGVWCVYGGVRAPAGPEKRLLQVRMGYEGQQRLSLRSGTALSCVGIRGHRRMFAELPGIIYNAQVWTAL